MSVLSKATDVILDHLDPPERRLGRSDWNMNVAKIVRALDDAGLLVADPVGVASTRSAPSAARERVIDALVMTRLSDFAGTDTRVIEQAADAVLAVLPHAGIPAHDRSSDDRWLNNLSYAATALESSADNGDRYSARLIREHLAAAGFQETKEPVPMSAAPNTQVAAAMKEWRFGVGDDWARMRAALHAAAAVAGEDRQAPHGVEYVRHGVCLLCGGAVLESGEHVDPERHADEVLRVTSGGPAPKGSGSDRRSRLRRGAQGDIPAVSGVEPAVCREDEDDPEFCATHQDGMFEVGERVCSAAGTSLGLTGQADT